jgi:AcrR family transcriptional regulator
VDIDLTPADAPSQRRGGRLPAAERRSQLLEVAVRVFARDGFHATSMNDVAEAAGVTKPVLYQHFGSKRDLFVELLTEIGAELRDTVAKATADAAGSCSVRVPDATRSSPRSPGRSRTPSPQ